MTGNAERSRKTITQKILAIIEFICTNPGAGTNEVSHSVGFDAKPYLHDLEELGIIVKEVEENYEGGAVRNHYKPLVVFGRLVDSRLVVFGKGAITVPQKDP